MSFPVSPGWKIS